MIDIANEIDAVHRELGERPGADGAGAVKSLRLQRDLDAPIDDVWDALTNPERLGRWFLPISGDYRVGGRFQFEGNAGGEIVECARPNRLKVTWGYGEMPGVPASEVEVRLSPIDDGRTRFAFEHTAVVPEEQWAEYGPGAVGVGWDQGLYGLVLHLRGAAPLDPEAWPLTPDGRSFLTNSSEAWGEANKAAGADPEVAARGVENTTALYVPPPDATS